MIYIFISKILIATHGLSSLNGYNRDPRITTVLSTNYSIPTFYKM